jgi:hypothetical protein
LYDDESSCLGFARAWGYDAVLLAQRERPRLVRTSDGAQRAVTASDPAAIAALRGWAQET